MADIRRSSPSEKRTKIGERVKLAATHAGISLKELAERASINTTIIYQYVRGITGVPADVLERISYATSMPLEFFDPDAEMSRFVNPSENLSAETGDKHNELHHRIETEYRHLLTLSRAYSTIRLSRDNWLNCLERSLPLTETIQSYANEAWLYWQIGSLRLDISGLENAKPSLESACSLGRLHNPKVEYEATLTLARGYLEAGNFKQSQSLLDSLRSHPQGDQDIRYPIERAVLALRRRNISEAFTELLTAISRLLALEGEHLQERGKILEIAAEIAESSGRYGLAFKLWENCSEAALYARDHALYFRASLETARSHARIGNYGEAASLLGTARTLAHFAFDDDRHFALAQSQLADTFLQLGRLIESRDFARDSERKAKRSHHTIPIILTILINAETRLANRRFEDALEIVEDALNLAVEIGRPTLVSRSNELLARIRIDQYRSTADSAHLNAAERSINEALPNAERSGTLEDQFRTTLTLVQYHIVANKFDEAKQHLTKLMSGLQHRLIPLSLSSEARQLWKQLSGNYSWEFLAEFEKETTPELPILAWKAQVLDALLAKLTGENDLKKWKAAANTADNCFASLSNQQKVYLSKGQPYLLMIADGWDSATATATDRRYYEEWTKRYGLNTPNIDNSAETTS